MFISRAASLTTGVLMVATIGFCAEPGRKTLSDNMPPAVAGLVSTGLLPAATNLSLALGLPLRNAAALDELLGQLYDPQSTNFHKFLKPAEFTARFGPTEADYAAVKNFALTNGFTITGTHPSRVVLDVRASAGNIDCAFQVTLRTYRHPHETRDFFAPDVAPSVAAALPILHIAGLNNYSLRQPRSVLRPLNPRAPAAPQGGSGPGGRYLGDDFRAAYVPGTPLTGSGQNVALLQFDGYYSNDIAAYISLAGLTNYPISLVNVAINGGVATPGSGSGNMEVCLDIEMVIAMAPGVSNIIVYEAPNPTAWSTVLSQIANDNLARQISCSWGNSSPDVGDPTSEGIFKQMAAQGQSFFNATGDSDAFVGGIPFPSESPNITQVGGTTLSTTGPDGAWSSESAWNWGGGAGTSGGISANYGIPPWQKGVSMISNHGSTTLRNVPDVALTGDNVFVTYGNGVSGMVGGTSCAAPLWAGFMALVNQQAAASGQAPAGFINPAVYAISKSSLYNSCFNDTTAGNNFNASSPANFPAVAGFDLCTGWGTPNGTNLINALLSPPPLLLTLPVSRNVTNGANVTFTASVSSATPFGYNWLFNGTNLSDGGNISGAASNILSLTPATTNSSGSYQLVVTNAAGAAASVAVLNVGFVPALSVQPASQTSLTGSSATFAGTAGGSSPLAFRWRRNGNNLANGAVYSGVTTSNLTLTAITTGQAGNYTLVATNLFGAVTSSVAALTVVLPPAITGGLTNRAIECGGNVTFAAAAAGTAPLRYQWSFDGTPVPGATGASLALTNVHLPGHTVTVVVTNLYASVTSNAVLTVNDTKPPVITLNGGNPLFLELGGAFNDPGASATDVCAGSLSVSVSGSVNPNVTGTNVLIYLADDGNGNPSTAVRNVVVRDTTPPVISWSFTNLVLAADTNCSAAMPDVTGTNFMLATDLSGALTILQSPASNSSLPLGTNQVVIIVMDASTNQAFSTNTIIVSDQTPPVITLNGGSMVFSELGQTFTDPGATANDSCAGVVPVAVSGAVDSGAIGTNTLTYTADDGNGNTNAVPRSVIVRDTTPPAILWSFTNLVLAANTDCRARLPDVTGTNYFNATDLSGVLAISQAPTNGSVLLIGTNVVVVAVSDIFSNTAFSTNTIIVTDQTPPLIVGGPQSQTNTLGTAANFSAAATACTPLAWQWFFNSALLAGETNSALALVAVGLTNAGNYSVVVTAAGGSTTSAVATLTVDLIPVSLALTSSANPSGYKADLNFTAVVAPPDAVGAVEFFTNNTSFDLATLAAGAAVSTNLSALPRGTNFVSAIYSGDASHLPATNTLAQIVTNHPPVAAAAVYAYVPGSPLVIAVAGLATNWTDVDGDPVSLVDVSVSTNGVVLTNHVGTLVYCNSNRVADQFVGTISDGWDTNFQTVNLVPSPDPTPNITSAASVPDGSFNLNLTGAPGRTYILETATNLAGFAGWLPVATNTLGTNGVWQFTDVSATNFPQQFYRLELAP